MAAVAGASPVTITVRTPSPCNSVTSAAESVRGGSLSAMSPTSFIAFGGPAATASTRKPCSSSSFAAAVAVGDGWARPMTTAKAPFTTRCVPPPASVTVASDIFVAGSNGTNLIIFGASETALPEAADRMAPSTGSCPPSELASAASARTCASSKAGHRANGRHRQRIARQRAGLVGAQHIHRCRFVHRGETRRQNAQLCQGPRAERRRKSKGCRQRNRDRCQDRRQDEGDDLGKRHLEKAGIGHQQHDDDAVEQPRDCAPRAAPPSAGNSRHGRCGRAPRCGRIWCALRSP